MRLVFNEEFAHTSVFEVVVDSGPLFVKVDLFARVSCAKSD